MPRMIMAEEIAKRRKSVARNVNLGVRRTSSQIVVSIAYEQAHGDE